MSETVVDRFEGYIFDLDGTVYLGDYVLPGSVETIAFLRRCGKRIAFITNKPLSTRQEYAHKLTGLGIPTSQQEIITSAFVLGRHLSKELPGLNYYLVGEENLANEFRGYGLNILPEFSEQDPKNVVTPEGVEAVIVAFDRTLDYRKLNTAYQALVQGAHFFATNADRTCPMPGGAIPDAGATIATLEHLTDRKVEILGGKPSTLMLQVAAQTLQLPVKHCLLVGDRLETDIRMGQKAGFATAVVLTGVTQIADLDGFDPPPDFIFSNLGELVGS